MKSQESQLGQRRVPFQYYEDNISISPNIGRLLHLKSMSGLKLCYPSQCFSTASVESMIVPSMSKSKPANVASSAGAL